MGDAPDAANQDEGYCDDDHDSSDHHTDRILTGKRNPDHVQIVRIKHSLDGASDTINLCDGTDAEKSGENSKDGKELGKPCPVLTHTPFNIVKWSAQCAAALRINRSVLDCQKTLGILGRHTEKSSNFHPEKSPRSAECHGTSDTDDITGTDRRGKCRTKSRKTGDFSDTALFILDHPFKRQTKLVCLQTAQADRQKQTAGDDEHHKRYAPYQIINLS